MKQLWHLVPDLDGQNSWNAKIYFVEPFPLRIKMNCIQKLCEICNALWKGGMMPRPEQDLERTAMN